MKKRDNEYDEFDETDGKKIRDNKLDDADSFHSEMFILCRNWTRWKILVYVIELFILDSF